MLEAVLPDSWIIRRYSPDYGIDLSIEIFEDYNGYSNVSGEHLLVQMKSTESPQYTSLRIRDSSPTDEIIQVAVIQQQIERSTLSLIEKMGSAVPVVLIVADIKNDKLFFICLNDYLEKIVIKEDPNYNNKAGGKKTINIPTKNVLNKESISELMLYSKRPKLYAIFNLFIQLSDAERFWTSENYEKESHIWLDKIRRLDVWNGLDVYPVLNVVNEKIQKYMIYWLWLFLFPSFINLLVRMRGNLYLIRFSLLP